MYPNMPRQIQERIVMNIRYPSYSHFISVLSAVPDAGNGDRENGENAKILSDSII
jgi:hypothetical protein